MATLRKISGVMLNLFQHLPLSRPAENLGYITSQLRNGSRSRNKFGMTCTGDVLFLCLLNFSCLFHVFLPFLFLFVPSPLRGSYGNFGTLVCRLSLWERGILRSFWHHGICLTFVTFYNYGVLRKISGVIPNCGFCVE